MTKNDLYNFRYIKKEINRVNLRIMELRESAEKTVAGSGSGGGSGVSDKVGNNAAKIADQIEQLEKYKNRLVEEEGAIMCFVQSIKDARLRLIIELYFIDCKPWNRVAAEIGSGATENSCKQYFKRKFEELEDMQ